MVFQKCYTLVKKAARIIMKAVVVLLVVALSGIASGGSLVGGLTGTLTSTLDNLFNLFMTQYGKSYPTDAAKQLAKVNFQAFYDRLDSLRSMSPGGDFGITQFADMSLNDFLASYCGAHPPANSDAPVAPPASRRRRQATPASCDWSKTTRVPAIKNQGQCGSCWTFNSIAAVECAYAILKNVSAPNFAEQNLVDCVAPPSSSNGCNGGWMTDAFNYINKTNGIDTGTSYPYKAVKGSCTYSAAANGLTGAKLVGYTQAPSKDEVTLKAMIATNGPAACAIDAKNLGAYKSGLYSACDANYTINHAINIVGYGTDATLGDYWICRNSWGTSWGESGNFRMPRNKNSVCGVADYCYFPKLVLA